jgi:hypothetical protein
MRQQQRLHERASERRSNPAAGGDLATEARQVVRGDDIAHRNQFDQIPASDVLARPEGMLDETAVAPDDLVPQATMAGRAGG